jgi:hypothetical protein
VFVEDAERAGADWAFCGGTEGTQPGGTGGVWSAVEEVSGSDGMAASVGDVARVQFGHGEIGQDEDAGAAGGRWKLVERGGECGSGFGVVTGLKVGMAGGGGMVSRAVIE